MADGLHAAAIHLSRRLRVEDEALGVSAPRLSALSVLVVGGPMRIGALAQAEQVEPPTMTRLVDAMERDGFVARAPDPEGPTRRPGARYTATGTGAAAGNARSAWQRSPQMLRTLPPNQLASLARGVAVLARRGALRLRRRGVPGVRAAPPRART